MGSTGTIVLVGIGGIVVLFALGLALGVFRFKRREEQQEEADLQPPTPLDESASPFGRSPEEEEALAAAYSWQREEDEETGEEEELPEEERPGLYDYFGEEDPEAAATAAPAAETVPEEAEAEFDKLCNLKTGRGFLVDCQRALLAARAEGQVWALCYFDFDRFRFINSLKGVSIGDHVLSRIAQELPGIYPEGSLFTRLSADHFVVVFPVLDQSAPAAYAEKLQLLADGIRNDIGAKSGLHIRMGAALTEEARDYDVSLLLQRANVARYCFKGSRTDSFGIFEPSMVETYLFGELAMEEYNDSQFSEDLSFFFQPISDLVRGRVVGCDALARWSCLEDAYKSVPITPDNSRLPTNNAKIFFNLCRWISRWNKADKEVLLACAAIPITDFYKQDIDEYVGKCLSAFQVPRGTLVICVDINTVKVDWSMASRQMKKLRDVGAAIAVHGVDRSYNSLDALADLPLDYVQLHRSFCQGLSAESERLGEVRRMVASAKAIGVQVIVEGVNTPNQAELLRLTGVNFVEGSFAGLPGDADDFVRNLQESVFDPDKRLIGGDATVVLDDDALAKGDYKVY